MPRCLISLALVAGCASATHDDALTRDAAAPERDGAAPLPDATSEPAGDAAVVPMDAPGCAFAMTGTLATWSFAGEPGNQASTAAASVAPGVTASAVERRGVTAVAGTNAINASNWPTAAQLDPSRAFTFTLAVPSGCTLDLTSLAIDSKASATGPTAAVVATSADAFAQTAAVSTTAPSTPAVAATGAMLEVRVLGYGASSSAGTLRLQNTLAVTGAVR